MTISSAGEDGQPTYCKQPTDLNQVFLPDMLIDPRDAL